MSKLILPSFGRGVVGPSVYARVDAPFYKQGLRIARNCEIQSHGGVSNRPGTIYIGPVKDHTASPRLFNFHYRTDDQYALEFGNLYMRVIRNDGHVLETATVITAATKANPVVVTATAHGLLDGEEVFITGVVGMTQLNGNRYTVANKTANTVELTNQVTGANIDGTGFTTYGSAGTIAKVFTLATPYITADLAALKMVQSKDTITITHPSYAPRDLERGASHTTWTLVTPTFAPTQDHPIGASINVQAGSDTDRYQVTAVSEDNEESLPALNTTSKTISGATAANPVVLTVTSHGFLDGDQVEVNAIVGMTELNGRRFTVANKNANDFELEGEDGSGYTAYSSAGTANQTFVRDVASVHSTHVGVVSWTAVTGAVRYNVYREDNGLFVYVGSTELTTFTDSNITPNFAITPPRERNPFFASGDWPGASGYYEQRQVYGGSTDNPDKSEYSVTGARLNMSKSIPIQADDAFSATLVANEVDEILHYVALSDLLVMTGSGEWKVNAGADVGFSIATIKQKLQSTWGSSDQKPIVAGSVVLFVEAGGARVRSLGFTFEADGYTGTDLTILANHLLAEKSANEYVITDWSFSRFPEPMAHVVRSDGDALVLTFNKDEDVVAWATWDTDGEYEATTSLRRALSGVEDATFFVIKRTVNGNTVRYIERKASRKFDDVRDCFFVDCGLTYDTPFAITGATAADPVVVTATAHGMSDGDLVDISDIVWVPDTDTSFNDTQPDQLNGRRYRAADGTSNTLALVVNDNPVQITGATVANPVVISALAHGFADGDIIGIFDVLGMTEINGITFTVANKTTDTFELSGINGTGYTTYTSGGQAYHAENGAAFNAYVKLGKLREATTTFTGVEHLEGKAVVILADGNVVNGKTITDAGFTLAIASSRTHVGLRYISDVELLDIEAPTGTIQGMLKRIVSVTVRFMKSRGLLYGPDSSRLTEMKQREFEVMSSPTELLTGDVKVTLLPHWNSNGRVFFRQKDPLPMTILGVIPDILVEDED